mmetsp:Transcript_6679/g.9832  ORF Transcript_6679/g.9832 Transcript_6679/m.9832 type:complete len:1022 (-) Transcript_6679:57-3122(-)|eukprot:CAMPEP_0194089924 /NCGR_PEP_ID=MMETSP0149-20130528/36654_1 /TAXON_ID=122233 /ORGANISM="Chaetoceros debilis, Strain MM31A-1" /LENGTH=1021 /DNA_ID=CAMNT_0038774011 /DNA_START=94 /DNA_END=3159 /DNA_ORIENTATION=+
MNVSTLASTFLDTYRPQGEKKQHDHNVYAYAQDRKPIITPPITTSSTIASNSSADDDEDEGHQYLLIPNRDHILVVSMVNGQNICKLTCGGGDSESGANASASRSILNTAVVVKVSESGSSNKYAVLGGFSDGTIKEWNLSLIPLSKGQVKPRRVFKFDDSFAASGAGITHITSPAGNASKSNGGEVLYALLQTSSQRGIKNSSSSKFISFNLPEYMDTDSDTDSEGEKSNDNVTSTLEAKCLARFSTKKGEEMTYERAGFTVKSLPFACSSSTSYQGCDAFVCICHKAGIVIYDEKNADFVALPKTLHQNDICALALSPNGEDVSIGYRNGKIDILVSVLPQVSEYLSAKGNKREKEHPRDKLVTRTIHWHSLPVKTLCYLGLQGSRATPNLLSGGEEAVLVTWSVDRGLNRPSHTLPRIAKGSITHIATNSHPDCLLKGSSDIVIRCMDDSLQLIQGHNHALRWKVQGLACSLNECVAPVAPVDSKNESGEIPPVILQIDPRSQVPIMTRMAGAPGFIHWFDPKSNQVVGELEVSPYNRISRKESHHKAYPRPTVTHLAVSSSGNDMITIDTMLSENTSVGNFCEIKSFSKGGAGNDLSEQMSFVTNMKFWSWSREMERNAEDRGKGMPYELIAAMPAPHGLVSGSVDALAISSDGNRACTLSHGEGAFHIWTKARTTYIETAGKSLAPSLPSWRRVCKIAIPSGYSSTHVHSSAKCNGSQITFSPDGSVLAIAFGRHVTLWDHTTATLLNSMCAPEGLRDLHFVRSPLDMVLAVGQNSVSFLAPFGSGYLGSSSWSYKLPKNAVIDHDHIELGQVATLLSRKEIAIALKRTKHGSLISTRIVLIDMITGKAKMNSDGSTCFWNVKGDVECLEDISQSKNEWSSEDSVLVAITKENEMILLESKNEKQSSSKSKLVERSLSRGCFAKYRVSSNPLTSQIAPIHALTESQPNKRMRKEKETSMPRKQQLFNPAQPTSALLFNENGPDSGSATTPLPTSQLPSLSGVFARSLIASNIRKSS